MLPYVYQSPTFTISRALDKSSAEPLNRVLFALVMSSVLLHPDLLERRSSLSNSTRRFWSLLDQVTRLACLSGESPVTKRSTLATLSTLRRRVPLTPSSRLRPWSQSRSILVFSSLDTPQSFFLVPPRWRARCPRSCG